MVGSTAVHEPVCRVVVRRNCNHVCTWLPRCIGGNRRGAGTLVVKLRAATSAVSKDTADLALAIVASRCVLLITRSKLLLLLPCMVAATIVVVVATIVAAVVGATVRDSISGDG